MNEPIISVSGLRGIVGDSLTPQVAARYAAAFECELGPGQIVVTRDGRASGPLLAEAIFAALTAAGRDVLDAAVAATPTTGVLVRDHRAAGGIQISASHNPAEYNGMKLFSAAGRVIPEAAGAKVVARYREGVKATPAATRAGRVGQCADPIESHWRLIAATVDVERIRQRRFRVLLDANHGAGSLLGRKLLDEFACQVILLGAEPDGRFDHTPEPTEENLRGVAATLATTGCAVGFCQDPDADRLAVIDELGRYIGEEYTLAICVNHRLRSERGPIVTNCSTSRMSQDLAEKYGVPCILSAVGEANVVDAMLAHHAILGGEGNGGVIDPRVGLVRDSFVGMAMLLDAMAARPATVSELAAELPRYEIVKSKIAVPRQQIPAALDRLEQRFSDAQADRQDGLRLDWPEKWLLVRASNTEPIVRAIAEATTRAEAERLCEEAQATISSA
jgi:phosphomannomutase